MNQSYTVVHLGKYKGQILFAVYGANYPSFRSISQQSLARGEITETMPTKAAIIEAHHRFYG